MFLIQHSSSTLTAWQVHGSEQELREGLQGHKKGRWVGEVVRAWRTQVYRFCVGRARHILPAKRRLRCRQLGKRVSRFCRKEDPGPH